MKIIAPNATPPTFYGLMNLIIIFSHFCNKRRRQDIFEGGYKFFRLMKLHNRSTRFRIKYGINAKNNIYICDIGIQNIMKSCIIIGEINNSWVFWRWWGSIE